MGVREGLERLEGVAWISEKADHQAQTCEVRFKSRGLPSPPAINKHLQGCGVGASLRSLEIRAVGELAESEGRLVLRLSVDESVVLAPLTAKVQWDLEKKQPRPASKAEKDAYTRLGRERPSENRSIEITGPYRVDGPKRILEVREFRWKASDKK